MIKSDIEKDRAKAKDEEDTAQQEFEDFESDSNNSIADLKSSITELDKSIAKKTGDVAAKKGSRADKKDSLDATLEKIKDATPGCDFIAVNFKLRTANRQIEIDGLDKAKAILKGGEFAEPEEPI